MVKYGESYITASSTATATAKRSTVKTLGFDIISTAKLRALGYVNYSAVVLDALNLDAEVTISPDVSKFRAVRQAEANLNGYTNLVLDTRNYVRTTSALTTTAQRELKEAFAQIWRIPNMGIPYIEGHDIQYEITEGYVYNKDMECYSEAKVLYTFRVPYLGNVQIADNITMTFVNEGINKISFGQSLLALENGLIVTPFDFDKTSGLVLGEFSISDTSLRIRLDSPTLNSVFGISGQFTGTFQFSSILNSSFNTNYNVNIKAVSLNNVLSNTTGITPTAYRRQISNNNIYASTATISPTGFRVERSNNNTYASTINFGELFLESSSNLSMVINVPDLSNNTISLSSLFITGNVTIYWGDGTNTSITNTNTDYFVGNWSKTYNQTGNYRIYVVGTITRVTLDGTARSTAINYFNNGLIQFFTVNNVTGPQSYLTQVPRSLPTSLRFITLRFSNLLNDSRISSWNVSALTSYNSMFRGCSSFNQPLNSWTINNSGQLGAGQDMGGMFYGCTVFNQSLSNWDTYNITNMNDMFRDCTAFNQPISRNGNKWNTAQVTSMNRMFWNASNFDQNISNWCVSLIATKPTDFDTGTTVNWITAEKPVWGTCP